MAAVFANIRDTISNINISFFYTIISYRIAREMNHVSVDFKTLLFANRAFESTALGVDFRRNVFQL